MPKLIYYLSSVIRDLSDEPVCSKLIPQPAITFSNLTKETLDQDVKYVQS